MMCGGSRQVAQGGGGGGAAAAARPAPASSYLQKGDYHLPLVIERRHAAKRTRAVVYSDRVLRAARVLLSLILRLRREVSDQVRCRSTPLCLQQRRCHRRTAAAAPHIDLMHKGLGDDAIIPHHHSCCVVASLA